ncbi:MAG: hypothetical protein GX793_08680 [Bacteroidales bacterium]|jgi:hypothetical protein|nr:hypothetical protein [Bacteroidales bacterium]NLB87120.1 hypothetical protein [Bacteroidales bacterium]
MSKNFKILLFFFLCLNFASSSNAQYLENNPKPSQRVFYGGDLGFSFGYSTYISVNPIVGYRITNRLSSGIGLNYTFAKSNYYGYIGNMFGGNIFASFTIVKDLGNIISFYQGSGILFYAEYNLMDVSHYYSVPGREVKYVASPMAGFAFQSPISNRSYLLIMVLYNFNETSISPYPNPVIKFSYQF